MQSLRTRRRRPSLRGREIVRCPVSRSTAPPRSRSFYPQSARRPQTLATGFLAAYLFLGQDIIHSHRDPGEPAGSSDLGRPLGLAESPPGRAAARIGAVWVYLEGACYAVGRRLPFLLFCVGLHVPCESRGRDVGELLIFSDTLTVLVPRCPVKADCVCPCVSLSCSGEGWSDCPAYFCCTWKGSALHPFSNLPGQSSHKGHSLHLISALGYFPSLPLGTFPAQLPSLPLPA